MRFKIQKTNNENATWKVSYLSFTVRWHQQLTRKQLFPTERNECRSVHSQSWTVCKHNLRRADNKRFRRAVHRCLFWLSAAVTSALRYGLCQLSSSRLMFLWECALQFLPDGRLAVSHRSTAACCCCTSLCRKKTWFCLQMCDINKTLLSQGCEVM